MGDILQDAEMCLDEDYSTVLRVGFIDEPTTEKLDAFSQAYDIIVAHDGSAAPIKYLLDLEHVEALSSMEGT